MNKSVRGFTLVIPTYNEADNIRDFISLSAQALSKNNIDFEIVIVDDNSPDRTWEIAQSIAERDKRIRVVRRFGKRGLATAVVEGWKNAKGDILGVMDGDLQQPPEIVPVLLDKLNGDAAADIVIASRNIKGARVSGRSLWRRFVSGAGAYISKLILPGILKQVSDPMSGFFIMRKRVINDKKLDPWGYKILLEVLTKGSYGNISEVPYVFIERKKGGSKAGISQYLISLIYLLRLGIECGRFKKLEMSKDL